MAINQNMRPDVLFTGLKINYKKELELGFGDYCEVYDENLVHAVAENDYVGGHHKHDE